MKSLWLIPLLCSLALGQGIGGTAGMGGNAGFGGGAPSGGGAHTFTLVQHSISASACTAATATCSITVTSTGAGNVGVLFANDFNGAALTIASISGGGSWTIPAGCSLRVVAIGNSNCAFNPSLTGGVTTITVTWSSSTTNSAQDRLIYYEYSFTGAGAVTLDQASTINDNVSATTQTGVTPTLTGSSDVIVQSAALSSGTVSSTTVYGNFTAAGLQGVADLENTSSTTPPVWTLSGSATVIGNSIALK